MNEVNSSDSIQVRPQVQLAHLPLQRNITESTIGDRTECNLITGMFRTTNLTVSDH